MDKIDIVKFFIVTVPENILNIYLSFLLTGTKLNLPFKDNPKDRRSNLLKLITIVGMFSLIQLIFRRILPDIGTFFVVNIILSALSLWLVYADKSISGIRDLLKSFAIPILQTFVIIAFLLTIESIYIPVTLQAVNIKLDDVFLPQYRWLNILLPQIDRFFQVLIILTAWDFSRIRKNATYYNCKKPIYVAAFAYLIVIQFGFVYAYIKAFFGFEVPVRILFFILCSGMGIGNLLCFKYACKFIENIKTAERGEKIENKNT